MQSRRSSIGSRGEAQKGENMIDEHHDRRSRMTGGGVEYGRETT